jgi:tetratricopeptide (TPR) repeat protein
MRLVDLPPELDHRGVGLVEPRCALAVLYGFDDIGRHADAQAAFQRAIEFKPKDWAAHNDLGRFYWSRGNYHAAAEQFRKVIELTPDNARGYSNLGGLYVLMGRYERRFGWNDRWRSSRRNRLSESGNGVLLQQRGDEGARHGKAVESRGEDFSFGKPADVTARSLGASTPTPLIAGRSNWRSGRR